jgi:hypothetical protein
VTITWEQIEARKKRLEKLAMGMMREVTIMNHLDDPLLFVERRSGAPP